MLNMIICYYGTYPKIQTTRYIYLTRLLWNRSNIKIQIMSYPAFSLELRELEAKLKAAYMNKERMAQMAEKEAVKYDVMVSSVSVKQHCITKTCPCDIQRFL